MPDTAVRWRLSRFMRWCSEEGVTPAAADASALDRFIAEIDASSLAIDPQSLRRQTITAWAQCGRTVPDWPAQALGAPVPRAWAIPMGRVAGDVGCRHRCLGLPPGGTRPAGRGRTGAAAAASHPTAPSRACASGGLGHGSLGDADGRDRVACGHHERRGGKEDRALPDRSVRSDRPGRSTAWPSA